jgi:hypothetical protein
VFAIAKIILAKGEIMRAASRATTAAKMTTDNAFMKHSFER